MVAYLLDEDISLRPANRSEADQQVTRIEIETLKQRGEPLPLAPQILLKSWAAATRPVDHGGFDWQADQTRQQVWAPDAFRATARSTLRMTR